MNKEIRSIISSLENSLDGEPWYGRAIYTMLREVDASKAYIKPNDNSHSMADLLYHMLTWADFTLKRVEKDKIRDMAAFEELDWREIDPAIHVWDEGLAAFMATHQQLIALLHTKNDEFLDEKVDYRDYDFRFLLHGLIEHNIYHIGQVAYLKKMLD